ncbi:MAG: hypothetical protein JW928_08195 [Candidatus Aureabacteria bacterium]|nr:hypothetical protein [Candidatus Auribacterota bacterium]
MKRLRYIFQLIVFFSLFSNMRTFASDLFPQLPLVIYSEAFSYNKPFQFVPSGWMGDIHALLAYDNWRQGPHSGDSCMKFVYDMTKPWIHGWAGVCWQYPANNWGNIDGGVNLSGATRVTFWAKGETGEEYIFFKVGGNYGIFSDSTEIIYGPVQLTKEWNKYSIALQGEDLSHIGCGFGWIADKTEQVAEKLIFYLDDMKIE